MKTRNTLALAALISLGMLGLTSCNEEHDLRTQPPGTGLLALGEVTVAGTDVAGTRAAIAQDAAGFTGIRKTEFKAGDALALSLSVPQGAPAGSPLSTTATLGTNGWTLAERTYYAAGTKLTATYTATPAAGTPADGIKHKDDLTATITPVADGKPIALTLTHANALIEVTPPAGITGDAYTIAVNATPTAASAEDLATAREEGNTTDQLRYRTIALPGTVNSIALTANGITYTATLNSLQVEANKRYPIALTLEADVLTATVNPAGDLNWGDGGTSNGKPVRYTRFIDTAEELAQFAMDVNADTQGTGASKDIVLQTADIELGNILNWTPIGQKNANFSGIYNGNGYTISNLKIAQDGTGISYLGLFGRITDAQITGVHLRNCTITSTGVTPVRAGVLAGVSITSIITLCSTTGSVDLTGDDVIAGGLIGYAASSDNTSNTTHNYITRCSANAVVTTKAITSGYVGGFTGHSNSTYYAGCIASSKVTKIGAGTCVGFSHTNTPSTFSFHAFGCIVDSEMTNANEFAFNYITSVRSCLSTQMNVRFYNSSYNNSASNASMDANSIGSSVTNSVTADKAYGILTANNVATNVPMKTLHWSKEDGYTITPVERTWHANKVWVPSPNGLALPTLDMSYEGTPVP